MEQGQRQFRRWIETPHSRDLDAAIMHVESQRKALKRRRIPIAPAQDFYIAATRGSFRLDGIENSLDEIEHALKRTAAQRKFRPRSEQRIRNHIAILHSIESTLHSDQKLKADAILRWYTSISSGLSTMSLAGQQIARIELVIRRIESPQTRLVAAIHEVAALHADLICDPLVPSFNGIIARLVMQYHLGRCGVPRIAFGDDVQPADLSRNASLLKILSREISREYERLSA